MPLLGDHKALSCLFETFVFFGAGAALRPVEARPFCAVAAAFLVVTGIMANNILNRMCEAALVAQSGERVFTLFIVGRSERTPEMEIWHLPPLSLCDYSVGCSCCIEVVPHLYIQFVV